MIDIISRNFVVIVLVKKKLFRFCCLSSFHKIMKSIVFIIKINNNVIKLSPQYAKLVLKYEDLGRCKTLQLWNNNCQRRCNVNMGYHITMSNVSNIFYIKIFLSSLILDWIEYKLIYYFLKIIHPWETWCIMWHSINIHGR